MYYQRKICNVYHTIIEDLSASHIFFPHNIYIYIFIRLLAIEQVNMNSWFLYQCIHGLYQYVPIYNHIFPLCFHIFPYFSPMFPIFVSYFSHIPLCFPYVSHMFLICVPYNMFPIFFSMFPLCFPLRLLNVTYSHGRSGPEPRDHQASGVFVPAPAK